MKDAHASKTADVAAAIRAAHMIHDRPIVFSDPYAFQMTSPGWRRIVGNRLLHFIVVKRILRIFRPIHGQMLARARTAEDALEAAVNEGRISQYVILGAGMDSFALRHPPFASGLDLYEIDHPATQAEKRKRMEAIGVDGQLAVTLLPADFERHSVGDILRGSSFDQSRPALFNWLGNTFYLRPETVEATLGSIATVAAPGSEVVFDYCLPDDGFDAETLREMQAVRAFVAKRGEPFVSSFTRDAVEAMAEHRGFSVIQDAGVDEQIARYFRARSDDLRPSPFFRIAHLRYSNA